MFRKNEENNEFELNSQISLNEIKTGLQGDGYLVQRGNEVVLSQGPTVQPLDISASGTANSVLTTNNSLETQWKLVDPENTSFSNQQLTTTSTPSFTQTSLGAAASLSNHAVRKQEHDTALTNLNTTITQAYENADANTLESAQSYTNQQIAAIQPELVENCIETSFIQNNAVTTNKLQHPTNPNEVLLSKNNTSPEWSLIENENIADSTIQDSKIVNLSFSKLLNTIANNEISANTISPDKLQTAPNRCFYVSSGGSNNWPGSIIAPFETITYALSQVTQQNTFIYLLDTSYNEDVVVSQNYVTIAKAEAVSNSTGCVIYPQTEPLTITGLSVKLVGVQVNTASKNFSCAIFNSATSFISRCEFVAKAGQNAITLSPTALYTQLFHSEISGSMTFSANPTAQVIVLAYGGSNVGMVTNSYANAAFVYDNCVVAEETFSNGTLAIYRSNVQAQLSFSSPSPQILALVDTQHWNATYATQTITKSGTSFFILSNSTIYNELTSSFSGTEICTRSIPIADLSLTTNKLADAAVTNSKISNDIDKSKIVLSNAQENELLACDGSGRIKFVQQEQQLVYNNNEDNFLFGNGFWGKIDGLSKFDSANSISSEYLSGNTAIFWGELNVDADTAEIRYFNAKTLLENSPNNIIPIESLDFRDGVVNNYKNVIPIQINSSTYAARQPGKLDNWCFSSSLCTLSNAGNIVSNITATANKAWGILSGTENLDFFDIPASVSLNRAEFYVGNQSGEAAAIKINENARYLAESYSSTNTAVPPNLVLCTNGGVEDILTFSKIYSQNLATTNTASANQILSYAAANDGTFTWIANTPTLSDSSVPLSKLQFNTTKPNDRIVVIRDGKLDYSQAVATWTGPRHIMLSKQAGFGTADSYQDSFEEFTFYVNNGGSNNNMELTPHSASLFKYNNSSFCMAHQTRQQFSTTCGFSTSYATDANKTFQYGYFGSLFTSGINTPANFFLSMSTEPSGICAQFGEIAYNDVTQISLGQNSEANRINITTSATIESVCDINLKYNIQKLNREEDIDYCNRFLESIDMYSFCYKNELPNLVAHKNNACGCQSEDICAFEKKEISKRSIRKHINFMLEDLEVLGGLIQVERSSKNISLSAKQFLIDNNYLTQQEADDAYNDALAEEEQNKAFVARDAVTSILFICVKEERKEIDELTSRLNKIVEFLNINV